MKTARMTILALGLLLAASPVNAQFGGGSGTAGSPYLIGTPAHLNGIRNQYLGVATSVVYYSQIADIDLSGTNWFPIGTLSSPAWVHYDGGGHAISNLNISRGGDPYVGLFGRLSGSVRGLMLASGSVVGGDNVGALVGELAGGSISNCESRVNVSGKYAGGLVGWSQGGTLLQVSVRSATNSATVYGGGLVGYNAGGAVSYSFAAATVVGSASFLGGLVGHSGTGATVTGCYWDTNVSLRVTSAGGTGLSPANMKQRASFTNWNFTTTWQLYSGNSYPYLRALADDVAIPVLTPGSGAYPGSSVTVTATCATADATLHYTIGRTDPTDTNAVTSTGSITVPFDEILKVVAWKAYMNPSPVIAVTYTPAALADTPTADQPAGPYPGTNLVVVLSSTTTNATIHYTTNGSIPTNTGPAVASGGSVNVPIPSVLKAIAYRSDLNPSALLQVVYTNSAPVATPAFNPAGGAFAGTNVSVTITCATAGAMLRYTTDGNDPTELSAGSTSNVVVVVPLPGTLKAQAFHPDLNPSAIRTGVYTNAAPVATPGFSPSGGTFAGSSVSVTVTCVTAGAIIRYTTDGNDPTEGSTGVTNGATVSVPIPRTLKARAYKSGLNPSAIQAALYENAANTATPTFNPDSGAIAAGNMKVTVSSSTPGATIRYTTDGSDPTETSAGVVPGVSVTAPVPGTLKAKAWAAGLNPSSIKTAGYTTAGVGATPTFSPDGGAGAMMVTLRCVTSGALIHYTMNGDDPTSASPSVLSETSVPVPSPSTLKARAFKTGLFPSPVKVAYYGDFAGGAGTPQDPYRVANALHLDKVRNYLGAHFVMVDNIDLGVSPWNSGEGWLPLGADYNGTYHNQGLAGMFDGQGHVISNLFINRPAMNEVAVFGYVGNSGSLRNLGIASGTVAGKQSVGGLVGYNHGNVSNCYSRCNVVGSARTGGLIGETGLASGCVDSYASGSVSTNKAGAYFGGLVGYASQAAINRCFSVGAVATTSNAGGLIGYQFSSTVTASYWDTQTSGRATSAGGSGAMDRTTVQMRQQTTFTGWDFADVWRIEEGVDYPRLLVFDTPSALAPPDAWLIRFYGSVEAAPEESVKGDPLWWEYIAGNDPTDPVSRFAVTDADNTAGTLAMQANSVTGRVYRLLSRTSLATGTWQPVGGVLTQDGTGGVLTFEVPTPAVQTFYRLSVELAD